MRHAPTLVEAEDGQPQPVPTKFGLTYTVPPGDAWRPSNTSVIGWSNSDIYIGGYGAVTDYGYGYCEESDSADLAEVGITGRNAVDLETAARDAVAQANLIYTSDDGRRPTVVTAGPDAVEVSGQQGVRYSARVTDIKTDGPCEPGSATFDIVATSAYSNADVAIFMINRATGVEGSLADEDVEEIIRSLEKTER